MNTNSKRPILVTGAHRSGTTWVGRMLAEAPRIAYIFEPFNPVNYRPGICGAKFDYWFQYLSSENGSLHHGNIESTLRFSYNVGSAIKALEGPADALRVAKEYGSFLRYRLFRFRPLIKDPIALFSAEWLASTFDMDVVVLVRHPAAFAGSLKRKNWTFDFAGLLAQPLLMSDHLQAFEDEIRDYAAKEHDIIDQASLLWKIIHHTIIKYQKDHSDWIFVRHEDLSNDPLVGFQSVFGRLDLQWSERARDTIRQHSNPLNPTECVGDQETLVLDSRSNITSWKHRLARSEIDRIRACVEDVAGAFYSDEEWQ